MPEKYTRSQILGMLPESLKAEDVSSGSKEPMSEVVCERAELTPETRRKIIALENCASPSRIIGKGKSI